MLKFTLLYSVFHFYQPGGFIKFQNYSNNITLFMSKSLLTKAGRDSSVGITTRYGLDSAGIE